ncbi:MAG: thioredoxin fold domain-containing protein [Pseudomonadota bacterium]|nr:thioredoxin fold domain-containing protein [Gammaproteobacteria bacterium]MBU1926334.1 thioredoxin fold domain-containing protein [Gammaproteobacteria bacterium]
MFHSFIKCGSLFVALFFLIISPASSFAAHVNKQNLENVLHAAQFTAWFEQGKPSAPHQIYLIADPNCGACHLFYERAKPYVANGQLTIRWILVAFLQSSSLRKAAAILSATRPALAVESNEKGFNEASESGGIQPLVTIDPSLKNRIQENLRFMDRSGFNATPLILFRTTNGKVGVVRGALPHDQVARLINIIGSYPK